MIRAGHLTADQIAYVVGCSSRSVKAIRSNLRTFRTPRAPLIVSVGRSRSITLAMVDALKEMLLDALKEMLLGKPDRQLHELAAFL